MSISNFKPFLISEFKTGQFNYLEPWIRPNEAFDPLQDAFIYRGSIFKRDGSTFLGALAYCDEGIQIAVGDGGKNYSGTLAKFPIRAGSMTVTIVTPVTAVLIESFTDNGLGVLTGSAGGTGTINYTTGAWTLTLAANLLAGIKIFAGYTYVPTQLATPVFLPIMAIKQFQDESNNSRKLVVCDTRRAAVYNGSTNRFDPLCTVKEYFSFTNSIASAGPYTFNTYFANLAPTTFSLDAQYETFVDDGLGVLVGSGGGTGTVNYTTGQFSITYAAAHLTGNLILTVSLSSDYFTGGPENFFNSTNWKPTATAVAYLYLTNDVDLITLFDGTNLARPPFGITLSDVNSFINDINHCLDVKVYKNRLLIVRPFVRGDSVTSGQSIRFSATFSPFNFAADISGNGGELSAPTDAWIFTAKFLRDVLICGFQRGQTWNFRFTGSAFDPFRFDKINDSKSIDSPYAGVEYDERITNVGATGLIACDGVNVQRYDISVIDQFLDINQNKMNICFAQRFDTLNQTWLLYPSSESDSEVSDTVLVYNFIENTWSTYNMPLSCLGTFFVSSDAQWQDFAIGGKFQPSFPSWESADVPWDAFLLQDNAVTLLGGTHDGAVVILNQGDLDRTGVPFGDNNVPIDCTITSTRWNPFMGVGERVQFGWVDFYYQKNPDCIINLSFFANNSSAAATTRTLTLDGPVNDDFAWKRIYINLNGEFIRMNMESNLPAGFKISGMVLWCQQSGRMTPGLTV